MDLQNYDPNLQNDSSQDTRTDVQPNNAEAASQSYFYDQQNPGDQHTGYDNSQQGSAYNPQNPYYQWQNQYYSTAANPNQPQGRPSPAKSSNGAAIGGFVLSLVSAMFAFIPYVSFVAIVLSILGLVFSVKGKKQVEKTGTGNGLAIAGLVLGIIGLVFSAMISACTACIIAEVITPYFEFYQTI